MHGKHRCVQVVMIPGRIARRASPAILVIPCLLLMWVFWCPAVFELRLTAPAISLTDLLSASRRSTSNARVVNPRMHFTLGRWFACHQKGHHVLSEVHLTGSNFVSRSDDHQRGATAGDIIGRHNSMDRLGCGAGRRRTCLIA